MHPASLSSPLLEASDRDQSAFRLWPELMASEAECDRLCACGKREMWIWCIISPLHKARHCPQWHEHLNLSFHILSGRSQTILSYEASHIFFFSFSRKRKFFLNERYFWPRRILHSLGTKRVLEGGLDENARYFKTGVVFSFSFFSVCLFFVARPHNN